MYHFCTCFDKNYLVKGLTLYRSIKRHCNNFNLYVLCLDRFTFDIIIKLKDTNINPLLLSDIEDWEPRLNVAKNNRSIVEYYFTLSPFLPLYILHNYPDVEIITYLDSDLLFYSNPEPIYRELRDQSILVIGHRFPNSIRNLEKYGCYNVQYLSFRRTKQSFECLYRWKEQCLDWCYDYLENGKYADQKYLDEWPSLYNNLVVSKNLGAGLAPWNWYQYDIKYINNVITVNEDKLIFYHFHGFKLFTPYLIYHSIGTYGGKLSKQFRIYIYEEYVKRLLETKSWLISKRLNVHSIAMLSHREIFWRFLKQFFIGIYKKNLVVINRNTSIKDN